jgi:hypothetical protein
MNFFNYRYNYVAGTEGEGKGLVADITEKATEAYVFSIYFCFC